MLFVYLQMIFLQFGLSSSNAVHKPSVLVGLVDARNANQEHNRADDSIEVTYQIRKQLKDNAGISTPSNLIHPNNRIYDQRIEKGRPEENGIPSPLNGSLNARLDKKITKKLIKMLNKELSQKLIGPGDEREAVRSQIGETRPENGNESIVNLTQETVKEFEMLIDDSVADAASRAGKLRLYARRWTRQLIGKKLSRWQFCEDLLELIEFDDGDWGTAGSKVEFLFNSHCYSHLKKPSLLIEFINKRLAGLGAKRVGLLVCLAFDVAVGNNLTTNLLNGVNYFNGVGHGPNQVKTTSSGASRAEAGENLEGNQQSSQENKDAPHKAIFIGKPNLGSHLNLVILIDAQPGGRVSNEENRTPLGARDRQQLQRTFLATVKFMVHRHRLGLDKVTVFTRLDRMVPDNEPVLVLNFLPFDRLTDVLKTFFFLRQANESLGSLQSRRTTDAYSKTNEHPEISQLIKANSTKASQIKGGNLVKVSHTLAETNQIHPATLVLSMDFHTADDAHQRCETKIRMMDKLSYMDQVDHYVIQLATPTSHQDPSEMDEIIYQPLNLKNLSLAVKYLGNLSEQNVYLCHMRNKSRTFDLALSDQNMLQIMLNQSRKPLNLTNGNLVKFEQFTMNKLQCEFAIDEHLPRKVYRAVDWFTDPFNVATLFFIVFLFMLILFIRKKLYEKKLLTKILLNQVDIKHVTNNSCSTSISERQPPEGIHPLYSRALVPSNFKNKFWKRPAKFKFENDFTHLKMLSDTASHQCKNLRTNSFKLLGTLYEIRHDNLNSFKGFYRPDVIVPSDAMFEVKNCSFVWQYNSRGSLFDIIHNEKIELDWFFKMSLLIDLINGMTHLHNSTSLGKHGFLTSKNCVVDSKWLLKITDFGFYEFHKQQHLQPDVLPLQEYLWTAPEILKLGFEESLLRGTKEGDVYSFGLIMKELIKREIPFVDQPDDQRLSQLIADIASGILKAENHVACNGNGIPEHVFEIMRRCVSYVPSRRMTFTEIQNVVQKIDKSMGSRSGKSNIVDNMVLKLEKYSSKLEDIVAEKTHQLEQEMKKSDELLNRMLPVSVARNLRNGIKVQPEKFKDVTVYFSDIVGFTTISMYSEPMEIIELLNQLYSAFDAIIDVHSVYKVETIGDAYMVVSGLPQPCDDSAQQICNMALEILYFCQDFTIPHMPSVPLRIRTGIHTGSVVAGVVGHTMPRYSIFGDTVNIASRMESTGRPQRIQISSSTYRKIAPLGIYDLQRRGNINLNGRGTECAYWLNGRLDSERKLTFSDEPAVHGFNRSDMNIFQSMKQNVNDNAGSN